MIRQFFLFSYKICFFVGFLLESEKMHLEKAFDEANGTVYWVPIVWAVSLVESARKDMHITSNLAVRAILAELTSFRSSLGALLGYDRISIPLAYTQVLLILIEFRLIILMNMFQDLLTFILNLWFQTISIIPTFKYD